MKTGQKIQELRKNANLTRQRLADALFVSRELVSKWERGQRHPGYEMLVSMAKFFEIEVCEIAPRAETLLCELSDALSDAMSKNNLTRILNEFLKTISKKDREIFVRRYHFMEDMNSIASDFGIPSSSVRTSLSRTRKKLAQFKLND